MFVESATDKYIDDFQTEDLIESMRYLDEDNNGDIDVDYADVRFANWIANGTITQEKADLFAGVLHGTQDEYGGPTHVIFEDMQKYVDDHAYFFDWHDGGVWKRGF